jgi:hypothetical protein
MAANPASFSDSFAVTAREEAERLSMRAEELRVRAERWIERGAALLHEAERLEARTRDLEELLGRAPQLRLDLQTTELQGQQLREEATKILLVRRGVRSPVHYREWYEFVTSSGLKVGGKNPIATFLTQITRSPLVSRVDGRSGVYELDPGGAYSRARTELAEASRVYGDVREAGHPMKAEREVEQAEERLAKARRQFEAVLRARTALRQVSMRPG